MLVLIGLGGNLGNVASAFAVVRDALAARGEVRGASGIWRTAAIGPEQSDFLNAALLLDLPGHPLSLLASCRGLEAAAGRNRSREGRWGPRPLDLDLLVAEGCVVASPALTLPHPRLAGRRFALAPAAELVPGWVHPRLHRTLAELAVDPAVAAQRCDRIGPFPPPSPRS